MIPLPRIAVKALHSVDTLRFDLTPLQLGLGGCPWRVIVASQLYNRTRRRQVRNVVPSLLASYPTPMGLAHAPDEHLHALLAPLELSRNNVRRLQQVSFQFLTENWQDVRDLPGCNTYVVDCVGLFCFRCLELDSNNAVLQEFADRVMERGWDSVMSYTTR